MKRNILSIACALLCLVACSTAAPVQVNTDLTDRLPKQSAIDFLEKQKEKFGPDIYGQCIFKHGDVRIVLKDGKEWEWINTYDYEEVKLYVSDNPITGRSYTLKGNDILIGSRSSYARGKECNVMAARSKDESRYTEVIDDALAGKIVSALTSLGVKLEN